MSDINSDEIQNQICRMPRDFRNSIPVKPVAFDFAEDFLIFLVLYPVLVIIFKGTKTVQPYLQSAIPLALFMIMTLIRRKVHKTGLFLLFQLLVIAASGFIAAGIAAKIFIIACCIIAASCSAGKLWESYKRKRIDYERPKGYDVHLFMSGKVIAVGAVVSFFTYVVAMSIKQYDVCLLSFLLVVSLFMLYYIYYHRSGVYCLKKREADFRSGSFSLIFSALFAICTVLVAGVVYVFSLITGFSRIDTAILARLGAVHSKPAGRNTEPKFPPTTGLNKSPDGLKPTALGLIIGFLLKIVVIIIMVIAFFILIFAVVRIAAAIIKKLNTNINEDHRSLFSLRDTASNLSGNVKSIFSKLNMYSGNSNSIRVRHMFYRLVRKYRGSAMIASSDSPYEIGGKIYKKSERNISGAAEIYEKARYGQADCEIGDVEKMRKYVKSI